MDAPDRFIARGFGSADGDYPCDWQGLFNVGAHGALDLREQHRITVASGVKPAEFIDAFLGLHASFLVALSSVMFARHGKTVGEERIWNSRITYGGVDSVASLDGETNWIMYVIGDREEVDADPPAMAPPTAEQSSTNGGADSSSKSAQPEHGLSRIGRPDSASAVSASVTSGS